MWRACLKFRTLKRFRACATVLSWNCFSHRECEYRNWCRLMLIRYLSLKTRIANARTNSLLLARENISALFSYLLARRGGCARILMPDLMCISRSSSTVAPRTPTANGYRYDTFNL